MKNTLTILALFGSLLLTGCGDSNFSGGKDKVTTLPIVDPITPYKERVTEGGNYVSNHCADISGQEHQFYGYMKNMTNQNSYKTFLESQTDCSSYNGWVKSENGNNVFYEYQYSAGTNNCSYWSQQPAGLTVEFTKGYKNTATIAIDATGNGWAAAGPANSQGFPVKRLVLKGQIDCSQKDLTIHSLTKYGWFSILVPQDRGNKNALSMRAQVFFNGASLGKYQLVR